MTFIIVFGIILYMIIGRLTHLITTDIFNKENNVIIMFFSYSWIIGIPIMIFYKISNFITDKLYIHFKSFIKQILLIIGISLIPSIGFSEEIGSVSTVFNLLSPNHKIIIEAFEDPKVKGVVCHLSRAKTGGLKSTIGFEEDPS